MTKQRFYPYPISTDLELSVDAIDPAVQMDTNSRYLRLWEAPDDSWRLRVQVGIPDAAAANVVAPEERADPPLDVAVTFRSITSRIREAFTFPFHHGVITHDLDFETSRWAGLVEVEAFFVRRSDAATDGRWASRAHTVVGRAEQVRIDVDEPARPPGDALQILWENFATSSITALNQHPDHLFALRESAGDEAPVLYLNQAVEGAVATLTSTGSTGAKARARDATFQTIAHQVWSSVLSSSLCELKDNTLTDAEVTMEDALDALPVWMRGVLDQWAPWFCPDASADEALHAVWELVEGGKWEELLTDRMPTAIASRFDTTRGFRGLVKEFDL